LVTTVASSSRSALATTAGPALFRTALSSMFYPLRLPVQRSILANTSTTVSASRLPAPARLTPSSPLSLSKSMTLALGF
jgi:hypothetical protein